MNDALATGIAVALLLLCALHWKLAGMPSRLQGLARAEREADARARAADDAQAQKALAEAVSARAGTLLAGVRQYQDQIAADFRKQVADAELRARVAERNAADTGTALETVTVLVRELRSTLDGLGELPALVRELRSTLDGVGELPALVRDAREAVARRRRAGTVPPPEDAGPALAEPDDNRKTIEFKPPAEAPHTTAREVADDDQGWDDPEERTKVFAADKPETPAPAKRTGTRG